MLYSGNLDAKHLIDYNIQFDNPMCIYCDNMSAIDISKNPITHSCTKYIPIKYHYLKEQVANNIVKQEYVFSKE